MKVASYDIVFQEIPNEVTLALNLSQCPCSCPGCHSPHLAQDIGEPLTDELLLGLLDRYGAGVTCVCLMGGDAFPEQVNQWLWRIRSLGKKSAWYSGRAEKAPEVKEQNLDFLKLGPYREELGGLKSPRTNQRLYRIVRIPVAAEADSGESPSNPLIEQYEWEDITSLFWKK